MVNITHKNNSHRKAVAQAVVKVSSQDTIDSIENNLVPKGNVFEMAKTAGLFAVKKTSDVIPDCHPLPIEFASVSYEIKNLEVHINMEVHTIYKTGVEVEAMHGVSVVALTMYDMLKPIDKQIEIGEIKLLRKKGGKSDYNEAGKYELNAHVIVCSDTISAGQKEDKAGKAIVDKLESLQVSINRYQVIPDDAGAIEQELDNALNEDANLIIYTGGTGLSIRDVTPDTLEPLMDRRIPGIEETIRRYGQDRMHYAMLSRSLVGVKGKTLVIALPGSTNGAKESMEAIFPAVLHLFNIFKGTRHD